jgi:hypothetical protein
MRHVPRISRALAAVTLVFGSLALAGCVEIHLNIRVNGDGSGTVTERVRFSEQVLDLAATLPAKDGLAVLLKKDRAAERVALMGDGCTLTRHEVRDLPGGVKECVSVYDIPNINNLRVCSPAVRYLDYETAPMRLVHGPHYTDGSGYNIGKMHLYTRTLRPGKRYPRENRSGLQPRPPRASPAQTQRHRDLLPVFKDLMNDFSLTVRIECYRPVRWATRRNTKSNTPYYYVLWFTDENLDQYGSNILESEEFMLALIRWDLRSPHIARVVQHLQDNLTVPVWLPHRGMSLGAYGEDRYIALSPSRPLFNKFFKGKPTWMGGDVKAPKPARISREDLIKWGVIKE